MLQPSDELLLRHLADGRFHSGQRLAAELNLSRTAIWKKLQRLKDLGLEIHSVSGKGHRLAQPLEWLDGDRIRQAVGIPESGAEPVIEIHTCLDSTNAHLLRKAASLGNAHVCLAETQTAGRGRLGRRWVSPFGCNVYLSLSWRFRCGTAVTGLSLAVGVAAVQALHDMGFDELQLKWPNDILWRGKKLGGILIEGISEHQGENLVVIGLGVNLWLPSRLGREIDQPWVDGRTIVGRLPPRNLIIGRLIAQMLSLLKAYERRGLAPWLDPWRRLSCVLGRKVQVIQHGQSYIATAVDVNDEGSLWLRDQSGALKLLTAGDVKLRVDSQ